LRWLGLEWDEGPDAGGPYGPYFQSERTDLYRTHAEQLLAAGYAYRCFCSPERLAQMRKAQQHRGLPPGYDGHCRNLTGDQIQRYLDEATPWVLRLKIPHQGETVFQDLIRGAITVDNRTMDDIVLLKSDGFPTYHLANVVDDHHMRISHVTRSSEWIPSTPKHIIMYDAFGWTPPVFAHLPVILDPSGQGKMSKRKKSNDPRYLVHVREFREAGYLPQAMRNYLALLGWSTTDAQNLFTTAELVANFDLSRVNPSGAAFSYDKLDWMNGVYIRGLSAAEFAKALGGFYHSQGIETDPTLVETLAPLVQERIKTLRDAVELTRSFFEDVPEYEAELLIPKKQNRELTRRILSEVVAAFQSVDEFDHTVAETILRETGDKLGVNVRPVAHVVRVAVGGGTVGPPLFESLPIIGIEEVRRRLAKASLKLENAAGN
ncbi:glutamate--tRNA ligase, partial [bacterium]|nr:glutamate--tRNA ligase [candidate division CSSED10-310 bacterium]